VHLRLNLARWLRAHAVALAALVLICAHAVTVAALLAVAVGSLHSDQAGWAIPAPPMPG